MKGTLVLRLREVEVVLSLETTFSVGVVGWVSFRWVVSWRKLDQGYLIFKVELEDELGN